MPKRVWNTFVKDHPKSICVVTAFAWKAPTQRLAHDGRQIPSPYAVFSDVLNATARGDWAIRSEKNKGQTGIHILLAEKTDLVAFSKIFHLGQNSKSESPPSLCAELYQFSYDPEDYRRLLVGAGYGRTR